MKHRDLISALEASATGERAVLLVGQGEGKGDLRLPYSEWRTLARRAAQKLRERGVERGDRVLIALDTSSGFLAAFLGAIGIGAIPCALSAPMGFGSKGAFRGRVEAFAGVVSPKLAITLDKAREEAEAAGVEVLTAEELEMGQSECDLEIPDPESPAFIQFTSGTTRLPKGVVISHRAATTNIGQINEAGEFDDASVIVSWLPLFHDMGLVGCLLMALCLGVDLILATPMQFLRRPESWLQLISRYGGTHSPAPNFAYRRASERAAQMDLGALDLSSWKVAYVGAEPIDPTTLRGFVEHFAACGFRQEALVPCYGMAEGALAMTLSSPQEPPILEQLSRRALSTGNRVEPPASEADCLELVGCGPAVRDVSLRIVDDSNQRVEEGQVGEIVVRGPSLFSGYFGLDAGASGFDEEGFFHTGDLGFMSQGQLFVAGRSKELLILAGENHHPSEIEWAVSDLHPAMGRVAAVGLPAADGSTEQLGLLVERVKRGEGVPADDDLRVLLRRRIHERTSLAVARIEFVPRREFPVTTSGKTKRVEARRLLLEAAAEAS